MQIGEHEVEFVTELEGAQWWDLWAELMDVEADEEGRFRPMDVWDWEFVERFLMTAIQDWDGKRFTDPAVIPFPLMNATVLAAYNHVTQLFLSSQQS